MTKFHLTKESSEDIDFASTSLSAGAVTFEEFKQWLCYVIEHSDVDDIPTYFFDILDIERKFDYTLKGHEIVGFWPSWGGVDDIIKFHALDGVAYKRFPDHKSDAASREQALKALSKNPDVEQKFRETFPFIDW